MDIKQLRALLAVAETGSATKAAEILRVVQPAVSRHIRLLEEELGAELFDRQRYGMALTDAGHTMVEYGRRALQELDRAKAEIRPTAGTVVGTATIGLLPSTCVMLASELAARVRGTHPQIMMRLNVGYAGNLLTWLESGDVEIALLYDKEAMPGMHFETVLDEKLLLVGPAGCYAMDQPETIEKLRGVPLILPDAPHGLRSVVEHACAVAGIAPIVAIETNSLEVQKSLVSRGFGHSILPSSAISEDLEIGTLSGTPIVSPDLSRRIILAHAATRRLSPAAAIVREELKSLMRQLVLDGSWPGATCTKVDSAN
ncbi:LysR family transcriptional regulator [Burkholderia sp. Ax-1719]|uniref:LysR family transcriptional regulator n=1 Tax=Burkholderia sp. Ax-1719 TaxID=2608334 RepID=UPI0014249A59|nr:LysR family transcriptional regulator [Burkholderia sp. Ax-1719]NIE66879.1 LysR family transcriptional regulator [Burkholderia sp. Ax-1719]